MIVGVEATFSAKLFLKGRLSPIVVADGPTGVLVCVDGQTVIHWNGKPGQLSLSGDGSMSNATPLFKGS